MRRALAILALLTTTMSPAAALHCEVLSGAAHPRAHGPAAVLAADVRPAADHEGHGHAAERATGVHDGHGAGHEHHGPERHPSGQDHSQASSAGAADERGGPAAGSQSPETHTDCRLVMTCGLSMIAGHDPELTAVEPPRSARSLPAPASVPPSDVPAFEPPPPRTA